MACRSLLKAYIPAIAALITLPSFAQNVRVDIDLSKPGKPLEVSRFALGQGGLSDDSIWGNRIPEVRALRPRLVRLFIRSTSIFCPTWINTGGRSSMLQWTQFWGRERPR